MESQIGSPHQFEYPTKFNKYRRMMERNNPNSSKGENAETQKEMSNFSAAAAAAVAAAIEVSTSPGSGETKPQEIGSNGSNGSLSLQSNFNHSPPKKIFISRACEDCQDAPLNLTTRSNQRKGHEEDHNKNNSSPPESAEIDDIVAEDDSNPEAMDVSSMSESMIIEDHFKRSLGSLYNTRLKDPMVSFCRGHINSGSSNGSGGGGSAVDNNNEDINNANKFNNATPTLSNHFNFAMSALFSNPPFIPSSSSSSSPTNFPTHPFVGLLNGNPIHDSPYHSNRFLGSHLQGNSFAGNILFNGVHHHHHHHQPPPPPQQQQQQHSGDQPNKRSSPSSASSSLHHSSSFNAVRPHKSSSPSCKSTSRHRFTPPDSYQPYPTEAKHRAEVILEATTADATSVSGCVDDHFSKSLGEVWKKVKASNLSAELEELMPTSVDDHFAKALGDKWFKIKSDRPNPPDSPKKIPSAPRNPNFFASPSSFVVRS